MRSECSILIILLSAGLAKLQSAEKPPMVDARIKLVSAVNALGGVGIKQEQGTHVLMVPSDMLTEEIPYHGPTRLQLVQMESTSQKELGDPKSQTNDSPDRRSPTNTTSVAKKTVYVASAKPPLGWIDLPANQGMLHLILLINPGKDNGITAITDMPGSFPPGSNRYFNLCPFPLKVKLPSGEQLIPGGASKIARPGASNSEFYDLVITSKRHEEDEIAFSGRIFHQERVRKLYFLYPTDSFSGRIRMKVVEDRPSYEKPPTPSQAATK